MNMNMNMNNWSKGQCMASKFNESTRRCDAKTTPFSDFCSVHKKEKCYHKPLLLSIRRKDIKLFGFTVKQMNIIVKQLYKEFRIKLIIKIALEKLKNRIIKLDNFYLHNLLFLYDSWNNVPLKYQINIFRSYWDIRILTYHFTQQLNNSEMEQPYPIFPSNPFTREQINMDSLLTFKKIIYEINFPIHIALNLFINMSTKKFKICYNEAKNKIDRFSITLIKYFKKKLRYKLINCRNSQNCFIGYWTSRDEKKSKFEELYDEWNSIPYQILCPFYNIPINNPQKEYLYHIIINLEKEEYDLVSDYTDQSYQIFKEPFPYFNYQNLDENNKCTYQ